MVFGDMPICRLLRKCMIEGHIDINDYSLLFGDKLSNAKHYGKLFSTMKFKLINGEKVTQERIV